MNPSLRLASQHADPITRLFGSPSCLGRKQNDPIQKPSFQPDDSTVQQIFQLVSRLSFLDHKHGSPSLLLSDKSISPFFQLL